MTEPNTDIPFNRPVDVAQIREARQTRLTASAQECRAIARHLGLESVGKLEAVVTTRPWRRHGLGVDGTLSATIGQICTLSGDPMTTDISEKFSERFYPEDRDPKKPQAETIIDVEATSDYETFVGETVDLGALVIEFLSLGVDPYPRKPGAVLRDQARGKSIPEAAETGPLSPFAKLAEHFSADTGTRAEKITAPAGKSRRDIEEGK